MTKKIDDLKKFTLVSEWEQLKHMIEGILKVVDAGHMEAATLLIPTLKEQIDYVETEMDTFFSSIDPILHPIVPEPKPESKPEPKAKPEPKEKAAN